jgi:hypothetical protein
MNTVPEKSLARKHFDVGYALYMADQDVEACQNDNQRTGWMSAYKGHCAAGYAAIECEITAYLARTRR